MPALISMLNVLPLFCSSKYLPILLSATLTLRVCTHPPPILTNACDEWLWWFEWGVQGLLWAWGWEGAAVDPCPSPRHAVKPATARRY